MNRVGTDVNNLKKQVSSISSTQSSKANRSEVEVLGDKLVSNEKKLTDSINGLSRKHEETQQVLQNSNSALTKRLSSLEEQLANNKNNADSNDRKITDNYNSLKSQIEKVKDSIPTSSISGLRNAISQLEGRIDELEDIY